MVRALRIFRALWVSLYNTQAPLTLCIRVEHCSASICARDTETVF